MKLYPNPKLFLTALLTISGSFAATPTIGVASAVGTFIVNSSKVEGNANLFDGSQIRTDKASSRVYLMSGAALVLGINSAGTIYSDHFQLNQGATKIDNMTGYSITVDKFIVRQGNNPSQAVVRLDKDAVEVAALAGSLNVFNQKGVLLTRIGAGTASAFQSGAGANQTTSGANTENNNNERRRREAMYLLSAIVLAGLGLAVDAILQPVPTSPG